ncbi:MAG: hypothetical protein HRU03_06760 [Nanoarchaeales archaeon]|nr:hypothetical protein [Nanoarchaeales archaeon]
MCLDFTFIYLAVFEMVNFPLEKISFTSVPAHVLIRYQFNNTSHILIETTDKTNTKYFDSDYIEGNGNIESQIDTDTIQYTKYLLNHTKQELQAIIYSEVSIVLLNNNKLEKSLEYSKQAHKLYPNSPEIMTGYISTIVELNRTELIYEFSEKISKLNKLDIENLRNEIFCLGYLFEREKNETKKEKIVKKIKEKISYMKIIEDMNEEDEDEFYLRIGIE